MEGDGVEKLEWVFYDPEKFRPDKTQEQITRATAETFLKVANEMKKHQQLTQEEYTPEQLAHFLVRLLFCLFAEDMELLPDDIFTQIVKARGGGRSNSYADLQPVLRGLFENMRTGGFFGMWPIRHFDGTLFDDNFVPSIPHDLGRALLQAAEQDWSQVDPSIFGTLFERVIDEEKRAQLGAHYTSEDDIKLIVEPVLMAPLRRRWDEIRRQASRLLGEGRAEARGQGDTGRNGDAQRGVEAAYRMLADFAAEVAAVRVLDPACGSGNFLYVALRHLLDLQKQVIAFASRHELPPIELTVSPVQLYGIEINPYAHELAQVTAWIGYLQWRNENGFGDMADPILRPLHNIRRMDAILAYDEEGRPVEPEWPAADVIIGNPPFLGDKKMISELGHEYVMRVRSVYSERLSGQSDLVCYWFEKARKAISTKEVKRVGLLATQGIRGGANRTVLERIKQDGDIFWAQSDRDWILDGATVHVSLIAFDDGSETKKVLDGKPVSIINSDLTRNIDLTKAEKLSENDNLAFIGTQKGGKFEISRKIAEEMIRSPNPEGQDNSDVIHPWVNGSDLTQRNRDMWIIDFGSYMSLEEASQYNLPIQYIEKHVYPKRKNLRRENHRKYWWIHAESRPGMRAAIDGLSRYNATPRVSKHRVFTWLKSDVVADSAVVVIASEDDYFFGCLHSKIHENWARSKGTQLREAESGFRYSQTMTFETFPFPWPPGQEPAESENEQVAEIAYWARKLVEWRQDWLIPEPPPAGVVDVAYDRLIRSRTLTNLYNGLVYYRETTKSGKLFDPSQFAQETRKSVTRAEIQELDDVHRGLDAAVLDAYGWPPNLTDEEILERLLTLNLHRAKTQEKS